jgi:hypothetical protein
MLYLCIDWSLWQRCFTKEWLDFFQSVEKEHSFQSISFDELNQFTQCEAHTILFVEISKTCVTQFINRFPNNTHIYWCDDLHHDMRLYNVPLYPLHIPIISAFGNCLTNAYYCPHYAQSIYIKKELNPNPNMQLLMSGAGYINDSIYDFRNWVLQKAKKDLRIHVLPHHTVYGEDYANYIYQFFCAFTSTLNDMFHYVFAKIFEIPATGCLLVVDDRIQEELLELGFETDIHCIFINKNNFDQKLDFILDPMNRSTMDTIRKNGANLIREKHTLANRLQEFKNIYQSILLSQQNKTNKNKEIKYKKYHCKQPNFPILMKPIDSGSGLFQDAIYYCPNPKQNTFQHMIALTQYGTCIGASNSYLTDTWLINAYGNEHSIHYENLYGMYTALEQSYIYANQSNNPRVHIPETIVMASNAFCGKNSGHSLGNILNTILYIREKELNNFKIGILKGSYPRILEVLELFYPKEQWFWIEYETIYRFQNIHFIQVHPGYLQIERKSPILMSLIHEIRELSHRTWVSKGYRYPNHSKILLLKWKHNASMRSYNCVEGPHFIQQARNENWIIIDPDKNNMHWIICILSHADKIVVSQGAISWTHMLFFHLKAKIIHLKSHDEPIYETISEFPLFHIVPIQNTNLDAVENKFLLKKLSSI